MSKKLTQTQFMQLCRDNNPQLNCEDIQYVNNKSEVFPECRIHGKFKVKASSLMRGLVSGCPLCEKDFRKNKFIEKANSIHNNKYSYEKIDYQTNKIPVEIICPIHGSFFQAPGDHLKGYGCSKCSGKYQPTTEEWVDRVKDLYSGKFDYSEVKYVDNKTQVCVICPDHGKFYPIPSNFVLGTLGCPECNNELKHFKYKKSTEQFIEDAIKIHKDRYDYNKVTYINKETPVCIVCKTHGEFWQRPDSHLSGSGCSKCIYKNQSLLYEKLLANFPNEVILYEYSTVWLRPQRFDIYFLNRNIAVEYDGQQHFMPVEKFGGIIKFKETLHLDSLKNLKCIENNCTLFRLKYNYTDEQYLEVVKSIIKLIK